jgi:hypothetical protein
MKKFFTVLLIVLLIATAGYSYWSHRTHKPISMHSGVKYIDLHNQIGSGSHIEEYDNGTFMIQYEVAEDQVFKVPHLNYHRKIKFYRFYTLNIYFDADGYFTGCKVKENPNSPLLEKYDR